MSGLCTVQVAQAETVTARIITAMADPNDVPSPPVAVAKSRKKVEDDIVICERCGAEMFRMHAVWRCPNCRFKTDCCGW